MFARNFCRILLVSALANLSAPVAAAGSQAPGTAEALAACYKKQAEVTPFNGVVLAGRDAQTFYRSAGYLDAGRQVPFSRDTRFRLASVQKVLTKIAVGQLVDKGRIKLDDPVGKHVPGLPPQMAAVTIDQLLRHRSGVASFTRMTPETGNAIVKAQSARDLLPMIVAQPLSFRPGERQEYSNGGYFLLGVLIEVVSGKEYGRYLADAIFRPLSLTATSLVGDARTAVGMTRMGPDQQPLQAARATADPMTDRGSAAGNGVSSADDLVRLGRALVGDGLLSRATKERLFPRRQGAWRVGQSGGSIGVNTDFAAFPENGWVLAVLSNYDPPGAELMGEALRGVVSGLGCTPLSEKDRPSPIRLMRPPTRP